MNLSDIEKLFFLNTVGEFNQVKKLYEDGEKKESLELFKSKIEELKKLEKELFSHENRTEYIKGL